jgi:PhoPQ-activated pathogenicity-related protein
MPNGAAAVFCSLLMTVFASVASADGRVETALDRYVAAPDPSYRYELVSTEVGDAYTANVLEMTSQRWRTAAEVDRPLWKHWLTIVRPERMTTNTGLLVISGGSNEKPPPKINPLPAGGGRSVLKFVVGGASKRGWAAWTTAAVDSRVVAIIPVVIDLLNLKPSFDHHYRSYGFWAPAVAEFERAGIMRWAHTPQFEALIGIEDPYS